MEHEYEIYMHSHLAWILNGKMRWNEKVKWGDITKTINSSNTTIHKY